MCVYACIEVIDTNTRLETSVGLGARETEREREGEREGKTERVCACACVRMYSPPSTITRRVCG